MKHPEPALGSSQIQILQRLNKDGGFVLLKEERALEKLWKKGYVRWQAGIKGKEYQITTAGREALERKTQ